MNEVVFGIKQVPEKQPFIFQFTIIFLALNDGKSMDDFVPSPQIPFFPTLSERGLHIPYSSSPLGKDRDETLQGYLSNSANVNSFDEFVVGDHYEVAGIDLKNHQIDGGQTKKQKKL